MIYYNEPFLSLTWEEDANIVCAEWKDMVGGEPMRRGNRPASDELDRVVGAVRRLANGIESGS